MDSTDKLEFEMLLVSRYLSESVRNAKTNTRFSHFQGNSVLCTGEKTP